MLSDLKNCLTKRDLSELVGVDLKFLTYNVNIYPVEQRYSSFCISKKSGGTRQISAPNPALRYIQRKLCTILQSCYEEMESKRKKSVSFGFRDGFGIYENAECHKNRRWVLNFDIEDFFGSINFGRVRGFFISHKEFELTPEVATLIAQVVVHENSLPQGAPTSPVISNLIASALDFRLLSLCAEHRCRYTRYVDDITVSTNLATFPEKVALVDDGSGEWVIGAGIEKIIQRSGFSLNEAKTRMSYRTSQQSVTGLVVNKKVGPRKSYFKEKRAAVHRLIKGEDAYLKPFDLSYADNCDPPSENDRTKFSLDRLQGALEFCYHIHDLSDERSTKEKFFKPSSVRKTYRDFLMYKYFFRPGIPIVLTEGTSDILYLKSYLKNSDIDIDGVVKIVDGKPEIQFDFFGFPQRMADIVGLNGGVGGIGHFFEAYAHLSKRIPLAVASRKTIVLVDGDDGLKDVKKAVGQNFNIKIDDLSRSSFALGRNLSLVVTPPVLGKTYSDIECFIPEKFMVDPTSGKMFSREKDAGDAGAFGKGILSQIIYRKRTELEINDMMPILVRLSSAILGKDK